MAIRKDDDCHHAQDLLAQASEFYRGLSMKDLKLLKMLGQGAFGTVLLCELQVSTAVRELEGSSESEPRFYAVKVLQKLDMSTYIKHRTVLEKKVMEKVRHNYIASLRFAFQSADKLYLGMPFFQVAASIMPHRLFVDFYFCVMCREATFSTTSQRQVPTGTMASVSGALSSIQPSWCQRFCTSMGCESPIAT